MRALLLLLVPATALARPTLPTWKHVTAVTKCRLQLEPASADEKQALLLGARKELGATDVKLSDLGDVVVQATLPANPTASRKLSGSGARKAASDFLIAHAKLFGIVPKLDRIAPKELEQEDGGQWDVTGDIFRTTDGMAHSEAFSIRFDEDGHVADVLFGPDRLIPAVPLCKAPSLRPNDPRVVANIVGTKLVAHAVSRDIDGGVVTAKGIRKRTVTVYLRHATELARVIAVEVRSSDKKLARASWTFYVDGDTGEVLDVRDHVPPDI